MPLSPRRRALVVSTCAFLSTCAVVAVSATGGPAGAARPPKPVVTGVEHDGSASGGTTGSDRVTVTGRGFTHVTAVRFGTVAGTRVVVRSSRELLVTAPAHPIGEVHVRVVTTAGPSARSTHDHYDFQDRQQLAGGSVQSCRVHGAAGGVQCWGGNSDGELGDGTKADSHRPVAVSGLRGAVAVAAGGTFTCALQASGAVLCWGANTNGQLGDPNILQSSVPVRVERLPRALAVAAGADDDTCAVVVGNAVYCWGINGEGQLGDGTTNLRAVPKAVHRLSSAVSISLGMDYACATRSNGTNLCWGENSDGELGDGSQASSTLPVRTLGLSTAVAVSAGQSSTCALLRSGSVRCWGLGRSGQLGNGASTTSSTPVAVTGIGRAGQLALGGDHACAVVGAEERCWGDNHYGQLGDTTTTDASTPVVVDVSGRVTELAAGHDHSLAVAGGATSAWGSNAYGQLGNGTTDDSTLPTPVG